MKVKNNVYRKKTLNDKRNIIHGKRGEVAYNNYPQLSTTTEKDAKY